MAETLVATSPLQGYAQKLAQLPPTVSAAEEPFVAMVDLWVDPNGPAASEVSTVLGSDLPTTPSTYVSNDSVTVIWLGPEEWLITGAPLEAPLRDVLGEHGAAVDVSAQRTTLRLSGPHVRDVLAKGCSIDLHPAVFSAGTAVQTTLGLAGVILIALDDAGLDYRILVRASFARYLVDWVIDAAEEFAVLS